MPQVEFNTGSSSFSNKKTPQLETVSYQDIMIDSKRSMTEQIGQCQLIIQEMENDLDSKISQYELHLTSLLEQHDEQIKNKN